MTSPPDTTGVVEFLSFADRPVLMLDTCILLDVIRAPYRSDVPNATVARAAELAASCATGDPVARVVVASWVPKEFDENVAKTEDDLEKHCRTLVELTRDAEAACDAIGIARRPAGFAPGSLNPLARSLPALARNLLGAAIVLSPDNDVLARAQIRNTHRRPPSTQGTQSKDPQIFEEYLDFARRVRAYGIGVPLLFCSSDRKAYGDGRTPLHPELAAELASPGVKVSFAKDLPWAWHELGLDLPARRPHSS